MPPTFYIHSSIADGVSASGNSSALSKNRPLSRRQTIYVFHGKWDLELSGLQIETLVNFVAEIGIQYFGASCKLHLKTIVEFCRQIASEIEARTPDIETV